MRNFFLFLFLLLTLSCNTKKKLFEVSSISKPIVKSESIYDSFKKINSNIPLKETRFLSDIELIINKIPFELNAEIYLQPNKYIWINLIYLGFSVGKVLITENEIKGYNKIEKSYFIEDYNSLKNKIRLNTFDLNFNAIQNLIIGKSILAINSENYTLINSETNYGLEFQKTNQIEDFFIKKLKFNTNFNLTEMLFQSKLATQINLLYEWDLDLPYPKKIVVNDLILNKNLVKVFHKNIEFKPMNPLFEIPKNYKLRKL